MCIFFLQIVTYYLGINKNFQADPIEVLKVEKNLWPQHFIYSKADILIPFQVSIFFKYAI